MPSSWGLFSAAIGESGGCEWAHNYTVARNISEAFARSRGCDPLSSLFLTCLRSLPTHQLLSHGDSVNSGKVKNAPQSSWPWSWFNHVNNKALPHTDHSIIPSHPVIDHSLLVDTPYRLIHQGRWARVPVIEGSNRDEFALFLLEAPLQPGLNVTLPLSPADLNKTITYLYGQQVLDTIYNVYPPSAYRDSGTVPLY
jgi:para-nitrobenzyl esterase